MTTVHTPTPDELRRRIEGLLAELRMTREEAEAQAAAGTLTGDQFWTLEGVRSAEFLLKDYESAD